MNAEGGPSGAGIGASGGGFSAGGEAGGIGVASIGGVGTIGSGGIEMGSISSGIGFAISTSESSSVSPGPQMPSGSDHSPSTFAEFNNPQHGDLSFLNPSIDFSPKSLATIDNDSAASLRDSDSFISGLLADLTDESEAITQISETKSSVRQIAALDQTELISLIDEISPEVDLANIEPQTLSVDDTAIDSLSEVNDSAQISDIRAELDNMIRPAQHSEATSTEAGNPDLVSNSQSAVLDTDPKITAISTALEHELDPVESAKTQGLKEADTKITTLLQKEGLNITKPELKKGAEIIREIRAIDVSEVESTTIVAEMLSSRTYKEETVGEEGEEQIVIEKIAQNITVDLPKPVVDEEVNNTRENLALDTVDKTIIDIQEFLDSKRDIEVATKDIWVSGQYVAEVLAQDKTLSGILEIGPDGSNTGLVKDLAGEWLNESNAASKISKGIRDNTAVDVDINGELVSPSEVDKVTSGKTAGIVYGPNIK